jgi:arylsulfatase
VCIEDLMPTVLAMANVPCPEGVDGSNLLPLMQGERGLDREYLHIETAPTYHCLTNGKEKFIWFVKDGSEQFFDLEVDPNECCNLIDAEKRQEQIANWRVALIQVLKNRPEGFSDGHRLISGQAYLGLMARK